MGDDLRRRAARHAQTGNYWAGKTLGLIDRVTALEAALAAAGDLLVALPPAHLAPERDAVLARIDALMPSGAALGEGATSG